jgi:hypothetical protein
LTVYVQYEETIKKEKKEKRKKKRKEKENKNKSFTKGRSYI